MTLDATKAAAGKSDGLLNDRLAAKITSPKAEAQNSPKPSEAQGCGAAPLFNPRTRSDALNTAQQLNAAALRCRTEARQHPGSTGLTLDRLAGHYAGMARDWFARADGYPAEARA